MRTVENRIPEAYAGIDDSVAAWGGVDTHLNQAWLAETDVDVSWMKESRGQYDDLGEARVGND